jgi:hypothetical protein
MNTTNDTGKFNVKYIKHHKISEKLYILCVLVSANNSGIRNGYREIFTAESLSQVGIFFFQI